MTNTKWKRVYGTPGGSHELLEGDGFYISYNADLGASSFEAMFDSDDGGPETALCKDHKFYILNGDYRTQYEKLVPQGFDACKKFYDQQSAHSDSSWSERDARREMSN